MTRYGILMLIVACALPARADTEDEARKALRVAESLVEWGDCDEAISWLEEALDQDPSMCRANYYLATCLMEDPELIGGRQVRGAVDAFEACAGPESAADVARLREVIPGGRGRRGGEDGVSDRSAEEGREVREARRPEEDTRGDRDEVRRERRGSKRAGQGRGYWEREDGRSDDESRGNREDGAEEERERRERDERAREEEEREHRERDEHAREERERREREERDRDEADLLTEIVIEDDEGGGTGAARRRHEGRSGSTLPDLDDEESSGVGFHRGKGRDERDPWEDDEEWKDPYLDD